MSALVFTLPKKRLTWLITGCSSGLGLALTRIIIAEGHHNVIATSRNPSRTPELVAEVQKAGGRWLPLDVTAPGASEELVKNLEAEGQEIDVLVNNAGFAIHGAVESAADDEIKQQMDALFFGPLRLIRAVVPYMRKRKYGVVVNMSSGASLIGTESMGIYAGGKAGLDSVTRVLAKEVAAFNIRTLTVVLGTFNTGMPTVSQTSMAATVFPDSYKGTFIDKIVQMISAGTIKPNGDKDKAMRAVYDVVLGEGKYGEGHGSETFLPLGTEIVPRIGQVRDYLKHGLDTFGDTTKGVAIDA